MKQAATYQPGDPVVYRIQKHSAKPGPRAKNVYATPRGEEYTYEVDKYWVVREQHDDGTLVAQTRQGKQHLLQADDPQLRPATWWERLWHQQQFPALELPSTEETTDRRYAPR
jgi:hypothetical protein